MRKDMKRVLTERPRLGSGKPSLKTRLRRKDATWDEHHDDPAPPSKHVWDAKELNDHIRPLYRLLRSAVGRPWNKVYSEIRKEVDARSTEGRHLLLHVDWYVEKQILMVRGTPYAMWNGREYVGLYVHPENQLLCYRAPRRRADAAPKQLNAVLWHDRVWFRLEILRKRSECGCVTFRDAAMEGSPYLRAAGDWARRSLVCVHGKEPVPQGVWYVVEYSADQSVLRKKVANRKELAALRKLLDSEVDRK